MRVIYLLVYLAIGFIGYSETSVASSLCQSAYIKGFLVEEANLCDLPDDQIPMEAKKLLEQIKVANEKIIKSLQLPAENPFLGELVIRLKISELSIIDSSFELVNGIPEVRLGTTKEKYYTSFSNFVYTHEMGHWYISYYLPKTAQLVSLKNVPTFQEFFADALLVDIYKDLDTSDIDAPYCIRQIRSLGEDKTFHKEIGQYDITSYFREANQCCEQLAAQRKETPLSKTSCAENKEIEKIFFPDGMPVYSKAPLDQNVHSLYLSGAHRLEPHKSSVPMNSFLLELSQKTNFSIMGLLLPSLREVMNKSLSYECSYDKVLNEGIYDLTEQVSLSVVDQLFVNMRNRFLRPADQKIFDELFQKYSMKTAQVIFRNEIKELGKFSIQTKLQNRLYKAWESDQYFFKNWHCIDQETGMLTEDCKLEVVCEPEDKEYALRREFIKRDRESRIFTPVVRFYNEETKKEVIFVGLNHTGPADYFKNVNSILDQWVDQKESVLLREFFTCDEASSSLGTNISKIAPEESNYLKTYLEGKYYPYMFFKQSDLDLSPLFEVYKLKKVRCEIDVDGLSYRPADVVMRNRISCEKAEKSGIQCQWNTIEKRLANASNSREGDLILNREPSSVQISSINMYRGLPSGGNLDLWASLLIPTNYVLDYYREEALINNVIEAFKGDVNRLILPWGVGHVQALKERLYLEGFKQFEVKDVPYASRKDYGLDPSIDSMLSVDFDHIGLEFNF